MIFSIIDYRTTTTNEKTLDTQTLIYQYGLQTKIIQQNYNGLETDIFEMKQREKKSSNHTS